MKKIYSVLFILSCLLINFNAQAEDCSAGIDLVCKAFNDGARKMKNSKTFEQFNQIDFDSLIDEDELNKLPESAAFCPFSPADRSKLKTSIDGFINAMGDAMYQISGGALSQQDINSQLSPMRDMFHNAIDQSNNLVQLFQMF